MCCLWVRDEDSPLSTGWGPVIPVERGPDVSGVGTRVRWVGSFASKHSAYSFSGMVTSDR